MPGCELEYNKVLNIHSNNYIINPLKDEQNEQEDKKQFVDNPSWLLRLFESPHFDMHLAISYLHGSKEPGVHSYIVNKMFGFNSAEVDFYLIELINILIAFNEVADILQPYLIYRCKTDIDFALKALCLLEAFYSSVSPNTLSKENNGLKLKDIIFADDLKIFDTNSAKNKMSKRNHDTMNEKVKSSLSVYSMHCQQFKIKGLHHKHQNPHHYRSMSDATNVIKLDILNQSTMMMPTYLALPPINANISTAVALQSHMFTNNNNNNNKKNLQMAAPLWNLAAATKRANNLFPLKTFGNLNSGKAFDNGCQCHHHHHMITNNTNTFQQVPSQNRYRSMDVIKTASSNSSLSIDSNNNNYYHLYNNNNTTYNIGPGLGVKNLIKFPETSTSKTDDITKSTKSPVCSSSSTRVPLCKCEAPKVLPEYEFLKSLHGIGTKLQSFPSRELRTSKLISEITLLNSNLPSRVWLPIYSHKLPHHILRIHPTSAVVLNSKDKVPFIVYIEVNECEDLSTSLVPSKLTEPGPFHLEPCLHCVFNNNANTKPYSQNACNNNGNNTTSNVINYNKERDNPYRFLQSSTDQLFNHQNQSIIGNQCFTQSSINLNIDIDNNSQSCDDNHNMNENNSCADTISTSSFANTPQYDEGLLNNNNTNTNNNNKNLYDEISQLSVDSYLSAESSTTKFFYNNRAPPPASSKIYLNGNKQQPEISKQLLPRAAKCHLQSSTSSLQHDPEDPSASILTEPWDQKVHRIKEHSPYGHLPKWNLLPVIVKCGDDLRQEQIAQQMLALLQKIWKMEHVPLWLYPYEIFVFNNTSGLIEPITNAVSLHHIKKNFDATLSYRVSCADSLAQVKHLNNEDRFSNKIHNHHVILPPSTALPNERENFVENDGKNDEFSAVISSSSSEEVPTTTITNTQISSSAATGAGAGLSGLTSMIKRINLFASSDPSSGGTGLEKSSPPRCQAQGDTTAGDQTSFLSEQPPFKKNKTKDCSLLSYFLHEFGSPTTERFLNAQKNFVQSCAAYCIVCYLLLLKDRHNGNILLDTEGHIIHIDFAFILSNSPRNLGFESSPFKLTQEFVDVMGGIGSDMFEYFKILMLKGLIAARKHMDKLLTLVEVMQTNSQLPCFKSNPNAVKAMRERFHLNMTEEQLNLLIENLVESSVHSITTRLYDGFQYLTNGIL